MTQEILPVDLGVLYQYVESVWSPFPYQYFKIISESSKGPTEGRYITITASPNLDPLPEDRKFSVSFQELMCEVCRRGGIPAGIYKVDLAW